MLMGFCCAVLTAAERAQVYSHESTALLCLRSMSPLQQTLVARMLFSSSSPLEALTGSSLAAMEGAVAELAAWGLVERGAGAVPHLKQSWPSRSRNVASLVSSGQWRLSPLTSTIDSLSWWPPIPTHHIVQFPVQ